MAGGAEGKWEEERYEVSTNASIYINTVVLNASFSVPVLGSQWEATITIIHKASC